MHREVIHRRRVGAAYRSTQPALVVKLLADMWAFTRELGRNVEAHAQYGREITTDQQRYPELGSLSKRRVLGQELLAGVYEQLFGPEAADDVCLVLRLEYANRHRAGRSKEYLAAQGRLDSLLGGVHVLNGRISTVNRVLRDERGARQTRQRLRRAG